MKQLNDGRVYITDHLDMSRIAFLVEETDIGRVEPHYLGQQDYTFQEDDVGRLLEVVLDYSPGFVSWGFGSVFEDLRKQYPETKPYVVEG